MSNGRSYLNSLSHWSGSGEFNLSSIKIALEALGNPQNDYRSVHVAGTNGKGSVSLAIAASLAHTGHRVGLTTSPHLISINERIVIDGSHITDEQLDEYGELVMHTCNRLKINLSLFEAITACAFLAFRSAKVDFAVVEVGLGGRLDATNLISKPDIAIITTIGFDHEAQLGGTLEAIAGEKAGIIKSGVPVFCGRCPNEALAVIEARAEALKAPVFSNNFDFFVSKVDSNQWKIKFKDGFETTFRSALNGDHQGDNMALALAALRYLNQDMERCCTRISTIRWPGRLEHRLVGDREVIFDCAHNIDGIKALVGYLRENKLRNLDLIFGVLRTKRWEAMLGELLPFARTIHLVSPPSEASVDSEQLESYLSSFGVKIVDWGRRYSEVVTSVIRDKSGIENSPILVTGSIYMIGSIFKAIDNNINRLW